MFLFTVIARSSPLPLRVGSGCCQLLLSSLVALLLLITAAASSPPPAAAIPRRRHRLHDPVAAAVFGARSLERRCRRLIVAAAGLAGLLVDGREQPRERVDQERGRNGGDLVGWFHFLFVAQKGPLGG